MLILPIQRIPRYQMFLGELVKRTTQEHPDFAALEKALESVSKQAFQINEACERAENVLKISEVSRLLGKENLLRPGRKYIREDNVQDIRAEGHTVPTKCYVFSDLIILSVDKKTKKLNTTLDIDLCWVRDGMSLHFFYTLQKKIFCRYLFNF